MPVADLLRLGFGSDLTPQQLADLALCEDRERRRALARGDAETAAAHEREARALAALIGKRHAY